MLLDEPLSNLDAKLRQELRVELKEILTAAGTTTIIVTHDQEEAMSLSDHVILMNRGRVAQQGSAGGALRQAAEQVRRGVHRALELVRGAAVPGGFAGGAGSTRRRRGSGCSCPAPAGSVSGRHEVGVRPERIAVDRGAEPAGGSLSGPGPTCWPGRSTTWSTSGPTSTSGFACTSGRRIRVVEKNVDQRLERAGAPIVARFAVQRLHRGGARGREQVTGFGNRTASATSPGRSGECVRACRCRHARRPESLRAPGTGKENTRCHRVIITVRYA